MSFLKGFMDFGELYSLNTIQAVLMKTSLVEYTFIRQWAFVKCFPQSLIERLNSRFYSGNCVSRLNLLGFQWASMGSIGFNLFS